MAATTDPQGKSRQVTTDAFGRTTAVVEGGAYTTTYTYNAIDSLACVSQSGQLRVFDYDQMGRLVSADNPETRVQAIGSCTPGDPNGRPTMKYAYDNAGNVTSRTDTAGVTVNYTPDALNRVQLKTSLDGTAVFTYDQTLAIPGETDTNYPFGRLAQSSFNSNVNTYRYEALGRPKSSRQSADTGGSYPFHYDYVPAGLSLMRYPSGRQVTTSYDRTGKPSGLGGYVSAVKYAPQGALAGLTFANNVQESRVFNARLQPTCIAATAGFTLKMFYTAGGVADPCAGSAASNPAGTDNNGNVMRQTLTVGAVNFNTNYAPYDGLNRIATAVETNGQLGWNQGFGNDAWGNRTLSSSLGPSAWTPPSFDPATNRASGTGWGYDTAGNLTAGTFGTMTYDVDGHVKTFQGFGTSAQYTYDGESRRVKSTVGAATTVYVYDAMGELAAEYGPASGVTGTQYLTADHLGSTRLVTAAGGAVSERHDYTPYGEEIPTMGCTQPVGSAQRSPRCDIAGYGPSGVRVKFTGKERDSETGLDYFGARYLAGGMGRFTTPDPLGASAKASNPQTWNRYAYTLNNPLRYVDPDGLDVPESCVNDKQCGIQIKVNIIYDTQANKGKGISAEQKATIEQEQKKVDAILKKANVQVQLTETNGTPAAIRRDALNIFVSDQPLKNGVAGISGTASGGAATTQIDIGKISTDSWIPSVGPGIFFSWSPTLVHEYGHQLLNVGTDTGYFGDLMSHSHADRLMQGLGYSVPGYSGAARSALGDKRYAVPADPDAHKPRQ